MPLVLADRVRDTTTTTGTGTVTLSGTAPTGYQNFSVIGNGNTTYYTINAGSQWEVGIGTYSSTGPTLARTTVLSSSNSGSLVNFSAGTKDVFVTYPAGKSVNYDASNNVGIGNTNPGYKLEVTGDLRLGSGGDLRIGSATGTTTSGGDSQIYNDANNMIFGTGTTTAERMRIDSSGNVGIGNIAPGAKLDVTGNIRLSASLPNIEFNNGGGMVYGPAGNTLAFATGGGPSSPAERGRFNSSGNLLIGTTTNKNRLTVTAGANTNAPTLGSAGGIAYFTNTDAAYGLNVGNSAADGHVWLQAQRTDGTATAYNLTLNEAGGSVGIRVSNPNAPFDVLVGSNQRLLFTERGTGGAVVDCVNAANSAYQQFLLNGSTMIFATGASERFRIGSAGQWGINGANYGSSGQVMTSQGSGSPPVWLSMGVRSNGQNVIGASTTLGSSDKGTNILVVTSGITITFPSSGYASGEGVAISNISGGNVTLSFPGGSDIGGTLPNNGSFFAFCDGGGYWRQYCYSTARL